MSKDNAGLQSPSSAEESSLAARPTVDELQALSHLAEQLNTKMAASGGFEEVVTHPPAGGDNNVDLDNLFAFLSEIHADGAAGRNAVLDEIEHHMNELATDFDQEIRLEAAARQSRYRSGFSMKTQQGWPWFLSSALYCSWLVTESEAFRFEIPP